MSDEATRAELRALLTRAAVVEAERQGALQRCDFAAVREHEVELSRLWARYLDLAPGGAAA